MSNIRAHEIISKSAACRLAAELIALDMQRMPTTQFRMGCCRAFSDVRSINSRSDVSCKLYDKRDTIVYEAQQAFEDLYRPNGLRGIGYWMGEARNNAQQNRRITALLTTAAILEARGE